MEEERRSLFRWPVEWSAKVRIRYQDSDKDFNCCVKNIHFKGIQLILEKKLPDIEISELTVILPNGVSLPMKVNITKYEVVEKGLKLYSFQITGMKDSDKELLYQLLNKNYFTELLKLWWKDIK